MKTIFFILFAVLCSTQANFLESSNNVNNNLKEITTNGLKIVKESKEADARFSEKSTFNKWNEDNKNLTVSKVRLTSAATTPRVPVPQLIQNEGYPVESHYLTTSDGYILNIFRIPYGKSGKNLDKVVYLQHGLLAASSDFVLFGPKQGLAYILADEGYDVWLGNVRGNLYSRNHTTLNPDEDDEFWQFSWHEIGMIDIPEMIDYILQNSGKKSLYHIGHSQGTTSFYVMASQRPAYNAKVIHHISLAPVAFMNHLFSPLMRLIAPGSSVIGNSLKAIGKNEFLPDNGFLNLLTTNMCSEGVGKVLCRNALFALMGFNPNQLNTSSIPLIMAHYPAGASTRQVVHYGQEVNSGKFRQFDFGVLKNKATYGKMTPTDYDLSKITTPITLMYSSNDWFASVVDVEKLSTKLVSLADKYLVPDPRWNHLDFIFANDVADVVYKKVINVLAKH